MNLLLRLLINAFALWATAELLPGFAFDGSFWELLLVALIFGLVNTFIRPIVRLLTLPLTVITLGLFTFVVNGLMLMLTAAISDSLSLDGGFFRQFFTAIVGAIIISIVSMVLGRLGGTRD
jgi:putative membrane protein